MLGERYDRGGGEAGDAWTEVLTGRWRVTWGGGLDYHGMPFVDVLCESEEVARRVVEEVCAWLLTHRYADMPGRRIERSEVVWPEGGLEGATELRVWEQRRAVTISRRTCTVVVDGETYSREREETVHGDWEALEPCRVPPSPDSWRKGWVPAPSGYTCSVRIDVAPETAAVLTAVGHMGGEDV